MRALTKGAEPEVLVRNGVRWTSDYTAAVEAGLDTKGLEKWRHSEIKRALDGETSKRCAYCEAAAEGNSYYHVEHLVPKASRPDLAHVWANLTRTCGPCNVTRDTTSDVLNPYVDGPREHLVFAGNFASWVPGSRLGENSVRAFGLNRLELIEARTRRFNGLRELVERWFVADPLDKPGLERAIVLDARDGEFSAAVVSFLTTLGFESNDPDWPPH